MVVQSSKTPLPNCHINVILTVILSQKPGPPDAMGVYGAMHCAALFGGR
jgi:hypothetical protein